MYTYFTTLFPTAYGSSCKTMWAFHFHVFRCPIIIAASESESLSELWVYAAGKLQSRFDCKCFHVPRSQLNECALNLR